MIDNRGSYRPSLRLIGLALGIVVLGVIGLFALAFGSSAGSDCRCHDAPDEPCIRQWVVLESIEFPYEDWTGGSAEESVFHDRLIEAGDSELWVIIQVIPQGRCHSDCEQIYVWYAPNLDVEDKDFVLRPDGVNDIVFSMAECDPRHDCTIRIALIEEDESYADAAARVLPWVSLTFSEHGQRSSGLLGPSGWSLRAEAVDNSIDLIFSALMEDASNDNIIGIYDMDCPASTHGLATLRRIESTTGPGSIAVYFQRYVEEIPCDLACSREAAAAPTQAEELLKSRTLEQGAQAAASAPLGFNVGQPGAAGVPANAKKRTTTVRSTTHTSTRGTIVHLVRRVIVIWFEDDSIYVFWDEEKHEQDASGNTISGARSRGDAASRAGAMRSSVRGELVDYRLSGTHFHGWGSMGQTSYTVSAPPPLPEEATGLGLLPSYDQIEWSVPGGEVLDLTRIVSAAQQSPDAFATLFGTPERIVANHSIMLRADELLLPDGVVLEQAMTPSPQQLPGTNEILVPVLDTMGVSLGDDSLKIPLVCLSGDTQEVTAQWSDERGWIDPGSQAMTLGPGEVGWLELSYSIDAATAIGATSALSLIVGSERLGAQTVSIDLALGTPTELQAETTPTAVTVPSVIDTPMEETEDGIPQDIIDCTEQIGAASGSDYKNSGFRNYRVPTSQRLEFFEEELEAYQGCPMQGACVEAVLAHLAIASYSDKVELAGIFWDAFAAAN